MMYKRVILLLIAGMMLVLSGCGTLFSDTPSTEGVSEYTETDTSACTEPAALEKTSYSIAEHRALFKITGRYTVLFNGITCDWSAAGIAFNAECEGEVAVELSCTAPVWWRVWINGQRQDEIIKCEAGNCRIVLAEGLERGHYSIKLARMTDIKTSLAVLRSLELEKGYLEARPADKPVYIEFVGDSLTCGTGIMNGWQNSDANAGGYLFMDATSTYAFQLANDYFTNVDYSFVSVAGSHVATSAKYENYLEVYPYTSFKRSDEIYQTPRSADLVVVNLGTNDAFQNLDKNEFQANLKTLIEWIRDDHGQEVKILFVHDFMNDNYIDACVSVIVAMGGEAAGLYYVSVERDTAGGANHPSQAGHDAAAEVLWLYIRGKKLLS